MFEPLATGVTAAVQPLGAVAVGLPEVLNSATRTSPSATPAGFVTDTVAVAVVDTEVADAPAVTGGLFVPLRPNRAFDSRRGVGDLTDRQVVTIDAEDAPGVSIPDAATGVVWNLTSVLAHRAGWTRGWAPSAAEPPTSSSNWSQPGETRAAAAVTAVSAGKMHVRMDDGEADLPGEPRPSRSVDLVEVRRSVD